MVIVEPFTRGKNKMSTDYWIFLDSDGPVERIVELLCQVDGVDCYDGLRVHGLLSVTCEELAPTHREVMLQDYGNYGIGVNWGITGTYDKTTDILELMERLFRCAAALVNACPAKPLSLMRNAESFYVFNSAERLILSPVYTETIPIIHSLFNKPLTVEDICY